MKDLLADELLKKGIELEYTLSDEGAEVRVIDNLTDTVVGTCRTESLENSLAILMSKFINDAVSFRTMSKAYDK